MGVTRVVVYGSTMDATIIKAYDSNNILIKMLSGPYRKVKYLLIPALYASQPEVFFATKDAERKKQMLGRLSLDSMRFGVHPITRKKLKQERQEEENNAIEDAALLGQYEAS